MHFVFSFNRLIVTFYCKIFVFVKQKKKISHESNSFGRRSHIDTKENMEWSEALYNLILGTISFNKKKNLKNISSGK